MNNNQKGFSLIELLLVVVIIGIIAAISIPYLQKAVFSSEGSSAFSEMRTLSVVQVNYFSQHGRFARLDELNQSQSNALGTVSSDGMTLVKGKYSFKMVPESPTDEELKTEFTIKGTKDAIAFGDATHVLFVDQAGVVTQAFGSP